MYTAQLELKQPIAIRYPRGRATTENWRTPLQKIDIGVGQKLENGNKIALLSFGHIGNMVKEVISELNENEAIGHYNMRFVKPLDKVLLEKIFEQYDSIITIEDGCKIGGFGSAILQFANNNGYNIPIKILGVGDYFIEHGSIEELHAAAEIDKSSLKKYITQILDTF